MTDAISEFIEEARGVTIAEAAARLGLAFKRSGTEHPQPCPQTGGEDRFSFNTAKNTWVCRGCDRGGRDAIGLAAHCEDLDLSRSDGLLAACALVLGRPVPEGAERESEEERQARLARKEARRRKAAQEAARRAASQADFRQKEQRRARGIYEAARPLDGKDAASAYLRRRGCGVPDGRWLRVSAEVTYWHGQDERGEPLSLHVGPAMIAPFIGEDLALIGCHITWIDLNRPPKCRPRLADPDTGEVLPTKKMRGTKKGGLIPLAGDPASRRWVGAEGIENALAFAKWERLRADTFYFAAGDLGNMAGPADPRYRRKHPTLTRPDRNGKPRPVMVPGPVPLFRQGGEPDAMFVLDHVDELVLIGDGDSEPVMTAAAMVRAKTRHARPGRLIPIIMPRPGTDFAAMLAGHDEAFA